MMGENTSKKISESPRKVQLQALLELRDLLQDKIRTCESLRDLAALSREYRAVMAEINEVAPPEQKGDIVDEVKARRDARRSRSASNKGSSTG